MRRASVSAAFVFLAVGQPASAQAPRLLAPTSAATTPLAGAWKISGAGERACRVQLNVREIHDRHMLLGVPPACKAAMPPLIAAAQWGLGEDGAIHIFKQDGGALYLFRRSAGGAFKSDRDELTLEPIGGRSGEAPRADSVAATLNALSGETPTRDAARAALVGTYAIGRARNTEDCAIELKRLPGPRPKSGGPVWVSALDASCADEGLRTFNPVGWQFEADRIFLLARKGHSIGFTAAPGGEWIKDPVAGRPLWMRKK